MSHILSSIFLAAVSNVDNLGVSVAYGVNGRAIRGYVNYLIALISGTGTLLSMSAGEWINDYMSEELADVLGAGIILAIGVFTIVKSLRSRSTAALQPEATGAPVTLREGFALALALTFNNIGSGLGAGISHVSIPITAGLTMAASLVAVRLGHVLGRRASATMSKRLLDLVSGAAMLLVGCYELFV